VFSEGLNSSPAQLTGALWICESGVKMAAQSMISQYKYIYYTGSKCVKGKSNGSKGVNQFYKKRGSNIWTKQNYKAYIIQQQKLTKKVE